MFVAAGVWCVRCGRCDFDCERQPAGWQHWLLPVHVLAGLLPLPAGHCSHRDVLRHQLHRALDCGEYHTVLGWT